MEAGTIVQADVLSVQHDKEIWGENVEEFVPERYNSCYAIILFHIKEVLGDVSRQFFTGRNPKNSTRDRFSEFKNFN